MYVHPLYTQIRALGNTQPAAPHHPDGMNAEEQEGAMWAGPYPSNLNMAQFLGVPRLRFQEKVQELDIHSIETVSNTQAGLIYLRSPLP